MVGATVVRARWRWGLCLCLGVGGEAGCSRRWKVNFYDQLPFPSPVNFTLSQDHRVGGPNPEIPVPPAGTIGEGGSANARACLVTAATPAQPGRRPQPATGQQVLLALSHVENAGTVIGSYCLMDAEFQFGLKRFWREIVLLVAHVNALNATELHA